MKLTVIGSSGSMSGPDSPASCYLIQAHAWDPARGEDRLWSVVVDLGPGSFGALWRHVEPSEIDAVVFTHGHADHMADIISLYVHHRWNPHRHCPEVRVIGPSEIEHRTRQIDGWAGQDDFAGVFSFETIAEGADFQVGPLGFETFAAEHTVEAYGYRVTGPSTDPSSSAAEATVAITGDTDLCDSMVDMAMAVKVLIAEAGFTEADVSRGIHMDGVRAGQLATAAGVGELVLTHIQPWTDPAETVSEARRTWGGPLDVARSGAVYRV